MFEANMPAGLAAALKHLAKQPPEVAQRVHEKWAKDHDPSIIWEGHKAGRDIGYCHLEKLHNLEALPGDGFTIACFPHKIRGASAGWTRAVAIFDDALMANT